MSCAYLASIVAVILTLPLLPIWWFPLAPSVCQRAGNKRMQMQTLIMMTSSQIGTILKCRKNYCEVFYFWKAWRFWQQVQWMVNERLKRQKPTHLWPSKDSKWCFCFIISVLALLWCSSIVNLFYLPNQCLMNWYFFIVGIRKILKQDSRQRTYNGLQGYWQRPLNCLLG